MPKEIRYLEEEQQDMIGVLDETAKKCNMETKDYNKRLAAIIIHYKQLINDKINRRATK